MGSRRSNRAQKQTNVPRGPVMHEAVTKWLVSSGTERFPVVEVSPADVAFPARALEMMPPMEAIPEEFHRGNAWTRFAQMTFFKGADFSAFTPREGVSKDHALRHLRVVLGSFAPKHEHKIAAAGFLLSQWFEEEPPK